MLHLALFAPPTLFLWSYWFDACAPNILVEHAVLAAFGEVAAVAATIFISARRMSGAKAIAIYGFALPPTAAKIRTVEYALPFWRQHVEVRDTRVQRCTQRRPVRRRRWAFLLRHVAFARDESFGFTRTTLSNRPQRRSSEGSVIHWVQILSACPFGRAQRVPDALEPATAMWTAAAFPGRSSRPKSNINRPETMADPAPIYGTRTRRAPCFVPRRAGTQPAVPA
jgi:hypothetical protein